MRNLRSGFRFSLASALTKAASFAPAALNLRMTRYTELIVTLAITSAERDTGDETYDFYLITGDGVSEWDLVHFPQVATTGAKTYTARISSKLLPENVTTAAPGVVANDSATLATVTGATNAPKSLAAGAVRHGPWGDLLRHELVIAGTVAAGIKYTLTITARE